MARQVDVDLVVVCVAPALLRLGQALSVLSSLDAKNSSVEVFETLMGVVAECERCVRATGASGDRVPDRVRAVTKWAAAEVCAFAKDLGGALQKAHADMLKELEGKAADKALADPEALYEPGQEKQAQLACQGDLVQTLRKRFQAAEAAQTALGELDGALQGGRRPGRVHRARGRCGSFHRRRAAVPCRGRHHETVWPPDGFLHGLAGAGQGLGSGREPCRAGPSTPQGAGRVTLPARGRKAPPRRAEARGHQHLMLLGGRSCRHSTGRMAWAQAAKSSKVTVSHDAVPGIVTASLHVSVSSAALFCRTSQHLPDGPFVKYGCTCSCRCFAPHSTCPTAHSSVAPRSPNALFPRHSHTAWVESPQQHAKHRIITCIPLLAPSGGAGFVRPPGPCRPLGKQGRFPTSCRSGRCLLRSMRAPPPSKSVASICSSCSPGSSGDCHRRTVET